jgi:chlorite dismutase
MSPLLVRFVGGTDGQWRVVRAHAVRGAPLAASSHVAIHQGHAPSRAGAWELRGVVSNHRYVERAEGDALRRAQAGLGRPTATRAALIPIRKNASWWDLAQDERRAIFEDRSKHIAATMRFLPAIARRLHHSRDLGEPFDFLTWFEFAPEHEALFDELVALLRATEEWNYVDREADLRLERGNP